jgi:TolB protein
MVCVSISFSGFADAKIYIDISSPSVRQLPVSIIIKGPPKAKELEWIIKNDLETTGMFEFVDPDVPGAEVKAFLDVDISNEIKVILSIHDLIEGEEVLKKRLSISRKASLRTMAHSISNDIYFVATDRKGIFRTKLSYLVSSKAGRKELRLMDWDGYNSLKIVSRGLTSSHSWTQDGKFLLYSSERKRKWKIYLRDLKRGKETVLFSSKGLNLVGGTSRDDMVAFSSSKGGSSEIYTMNLYGQKFKRLTRSYGIDVSPVFSPDGEKIVFVSDRGGSPQIYIMDTKGRGIKRLTFEGSYNTSPSWSADGKRIAYVGRKNGKNQIFVVNSDGKDLRQLTFEGNNEGPSFSPDGFFIAFDSDRVGSRGIYMMRINGEGQKRITPKYLKAMSPKWSPYFK